MLFIVLVKTAFKLAWDKFGHMGIFLHANSQIKRTFPSRVMAETIFTGPTTCRAKYSETTVWGGDFVPYFSH